MSCRCCGKALAARYIAIEQRVERLEAAEDHFICHVLSADAYPLWCSTPCWQADGLAFIASLGFTHVYPATGSECPCALCSKPVDRLKPYVSIVMTDIEVDEKPWLTTGMIHDEEAIAVICHECQLADQAAGDSDRLRRRLIEAMI